MIDLDALQGMWEKDSKIDMDNLHTESTNIPTLHAKYFEMYNTIFLMRKKAEQQRKNIRHERYEYFSGKADPDVYVENPFPKNTTDPRGLPINVKTQGFDAPFRQVGILTRHGTSGKETILPLMGRPLITNRNKWNFYAMSESNNMIKLQVTSVNSNGSSNHRNCMTSNGCDDLMTGDLVKVDGYNDLFKVTTYENDTPRYLPYI